MLSDHGAKRLDGGIRINEWLRREGLLATLAEPNGVSSLRDVGVDWSKTTAWGEGGYYARVFLNVAGREPEGTIAPEDYEAVRDDLARRIAEIPDDAGNPIPTAVYKPEQLYGEPKGVAPDLIVVFGDLYWRSVGTIGGDEGVQTLENDTGPGRREPRAGRALRRGRAGHRRDRARRRTPPRHRADGARDPRDRRAGRPTRTQPALRSRSQLSAVQSISRNVRLKKP